MPGPANAQTTSAGCAVLVIDRHAPLPGRSQRTLMGALICCRIRFVPLVERSDLAMAGAEVQPRGGFVRVHQSHSREAVGEESNSLSPNHSGSQFAPVVATSSPRSSSVLRGCSSSPSHPSCTTGAVPGCRARHGSRHHCRANTCWPDRAQFLVRRPRCACVSWDRCVERRCRQGA